MLRQCQMTDTEKPEKDNSKQDYLLYLESLKFKRIYHYRDLQADGYGSRATIWRKIKSGSFPAPLIEPDGRPFWTREMIEEYVESCRSA